MPRRSPSTRAWNHRGEAAFIEVEVRGEAAALRAAEPSASSQEESGERYPCLLMLDNLAPREISPILDSLRREGLWDYIACRSQRRNHPEEYRSLTRHTGVDAISIGALTHSARALDLCQRIS